MHLYATKEPSGLPGRLRPRRGVSAALVVHTAAFLWFARVWLFHLEPAAQALPGATGYGWFFRFLTFYSFTLQTAALGLAATEDWVALLGRGGGWAAVEAAADDLCCSLFGLAHVVTFLYYGIQAATNQRGMADANGAPRPAWLDPSVHALNAAAAWGDLLAARRRSFGRRAAQISVGLICGYLALIQLCRHLNGEYPYPFLRGAKQPEAFLLTAATGCLLHAAAFKAGAALNARLPLAAAAAAAAALAAVDRYCHLHSSLAQAARAAAAAAASRAGAARGVRARAFVLVRRAGGGVTA
ncbi:MAG: FAR-17a/AIG1-like protein-domain-containing protein [Monoraphidium minutum]|nr:MAG: FAR-17a/AIG1-like protein-domain-containing protein [Monoraphidium minutum]